MKGVSIKYIGRALLIITLIGVTISGLGAYNLYQSLNRVERIDIQRLEQAVELPKASASKVFLVFSVGSEGLTEGSVDRTGIGRVRGVMEDGLTDSIMLIVANPKSKKLGIISFPRDLWLESYSTRINEVYKRKGVLELITALEGYSGLTIDHVVKSNFAGFVDIVDLLGGVDVFLETYARDSKSKLNLTIGCNQLDGKMALAFARSRHWQISSDNRNWRNDRTSSDFGRIERQQYILEELSLKLKNPLMLTKISQILNVASANIALDTGLSAAEIARWVGSFATGVSSIEKVTIPGVGFTTSLGASVLSFDEENTKTISLDLYEKVTNNDNNELMKDIVTEQTETPEMLSKEKRVSDQKEFSNQSCANQLKTQGRS